jgi:hypothetical protein
VKMFGQAALQVGCEADVEIGVVHGHEDVDAVLELGGHPGSRAKLTAGRKSEMRKKQEENQDVR